MKVHPVKLPLFAYGTLKRGEKYYGTFERFKPKTVDEAFTLGKLYYVPYIEKIVDNKKSLAVTVALEPEGCQRISGQLLTFEDSVADRALAESDDKEFNFHDQSTREKKDRVFIRTVITCYSRSGEAVLAWAYIYVSLDEAHKPKVLVNPNTISFGTHASFEHIGISEYKDLLKQAALKT